MPGAVVPEACAAAQQLDVEGIAVFVVDVTSADRLYRAWRDELRSAAGAARPARDDHPLASLLAGHERRLLIVTVHDG